MEKVRIAVAGAGSIGLRHTPGYAPAMLGSLASAPTSA
jgi:hypothetical protein